jgi:hypothetical protein
MLHYDRLRTAVRRTCELRRTSFSLGSTSVTTDQAGAYVTELRYYPYGKPRYNPGGQTTDQVTFSVSGEKTGRTAAAVARIRASKRSNQNERGW